MRLRAGGAGHLHIHRLLPRILRGHQGLGHGHGHHQISVAEPDPVGSGLFGIQGSGSVFSETESRIQFQMDRIQKALNQNLIPFF